MKQSTLIVWSEFKPPFIRSYNRQYPKKRSNRSNGDKTQARQRVNYLVLRGWLPKPKYCHCVDCNNQASEYDHYKGYEIEYHEIVEPVCKECHESRKLQS